MNTSEALYIRYKPVLDSCEFFRNLGEEHWKELLLSFREELWTKNTCILNRKKFLFHFYIICRGRVKMYRLAENSLKEHTLFLLSKGDVFDVFCLFDGDKHRVYYECLDSTKVLAIRMDELRRWMQQQPQFYPMFLQYAAKMMRKLEKTASELIFTDLSTRLLQLILSNINERNQQLELIDNLPNKELASMVGSTRAVVNRYLQTLKKKGAIQITRNRIKIMNMDLLLKELKIHSGNS